jgi:hypothetical protein
LEKQTRASRKRLRRPERPGQARRKHETVLSTNGCVVIGVSVLFRYFSNWGIACHAYFSWGGKRS